MLRVLGAECRLRSEGESGEEDRWKDGAEHGNPVRRVVVKMGPDPCFVHLDGQPSAPGFHGAGTPVHRS